MTEEQNEDTGIQLSEEDKKRRLRRSIALGLVLAFLVGLFFVITFWKFPSPINRPL